LVDKSGKDRLDYIMEVGDSKGDLPHTPNLPNCGDSLNFDISD
jgi:hypothetical protein